ncbi:MAG: radical SAM family heme chaperone HemW [Thermoleophilia bacterium]
MKHLYVHIPFCRSRCDYCDFASELLEPHARAGRVTAYLTALRSELALRGASLERPPETIYLGGGTPTALPQPALLDLVRELSAPREGGIRRSPAEFTVEANPGTIDASLLTQLAAAGVTRLSLGVQSFAPALRAALGRRVSQAEVMAALQAVKVAGWKEWNIDLVFGIPGQTWKEAAADIDAAVAAAPTHISFYDLTYSAAYAARVDRDMGSEARRRAGDFAEQHYGCAVARLEAAGYSRYEVSNFALPGHECRHNLAYWRGEDYLGLGASATSTVGGERRTNPTSVADYLAGLPADVELLSTFTRVWEKAMLGLRTCEGVSEDAVRPALDPAQLELLVSRGWVERHCGKMRLNPGFMNVSNGVLTTLLRTPDDV